MKKLIIFTLIFLTLTLGVKFIFTPGISFILDSVFYPFNSFRGFFEATLYFHFNDFLNMIFGYIIFSKIYIIGTYIAGVLLGVYITKYIIDSYEIKNKKNIFFLQAISIIFLLFNPFIYERFVTQVGIALGVFMIGFGVIFLLNFLKTKLDKHLYLSSLFFAISLSIFPHALVLILLFGIIIFTFYFKSFSVKNIALSFIIFLSINLNWIMGDIFLQISGPIQTTKTFNELNIEAFKSNAIKPLNIEGTHLLLYGFWGEKYGHVITPDKQNPKWFLAGFMILFFIILGIYAFFKKDKKLTIALIIVGIISYILSFGITSGNFYSINKFLFENIPYYIGMREPHKWLGITAVIYAIFFVFGMKFLFDLMIRFKKKLGLEDDKYIYNIYAGIILVSAIIFAWSPNILGGYNGQFIISNYPVEYFELKDFMDEKVDKKDKIVLFPWHSYIACDYSYGKVFANITNNIFGNYNFIVGDNIEIGPLYTNSDNPISKDVISFLNSKDISYLQSNDIKYIINLKTCADFGNYTFLQERTDLKNIFNSDKIELYEIIYQK